MSELQSSALHADQAWMKQAIALALQGHTAPSQIQM